MLRASIFLGLVLVAAFSALGQVKTPLRLEVTSPKPLMIAAIDSPTGEAHGVLVGEYAELLQKKFQSSSPIYIDVSTERRYSQPGCSRLKVTIWQDGVRLSTGDAPSKQGAHFGINYCRDGLPPKSLS